MDERPESGLRKTGNIRRPPVQETSDPAGRKPVAQWVVSGSTVRPADEVFPQLNDEVRPAPPGWPVRWPVRWLVAGIVCGLLAALPLALCFLRDRLVR